MSLEQKKKHPHIHSSQTFTVPAELPRIFKYIHKISKNQYFLCSSSHKYDYCTLSVDTNKTNTGSSRVPGRLQNETEVNDHWGDSGRMHEVRGGEAGVQGPCHIPRMSENLGYRLSEQVLNKGKQNDHILAQISINYKYITNDRENYVVEFFENGAFFYEKLCTNT